MRFGCIEIVMWRRDGEKRRKRTRKGEEGERKERQERKRHSPLLCSDGRICDVASNSVNKNRQ